MNWIDPWGLWSFDQFYKDNFEYGNWGGGGHSGGSTGKEPPIDEMDALFEQHDYGYGRGEYEKADKDLVEGLKNLPENPRNWNPPAPDPFTAQSYRQKAEALFEEIVKNREKNKCK